MCTNYKDLLALYFWLKTFKAFPKNNASLVLSAHAPHLYSSRRNHASVTEKS